MTIDEGTLELSNNAAAGSGKITFGTGSNATIEVDDNVYAPNLISGLGAGDAIKFGVNGSATLAGPASGGEIDFSPSAVDYARLKSGSTLGATFNNFGAGDEVDFEAVKYASTDKLVYAKGVVMIENSAGHTVASFHVSGTHTSANFKLSNDGSGHILVSYVDPRAPAVSEAVVGSPADLVGRYDSQFAIPIAETHNGVVGLDSLLPPVLVAETYAGGLGYHHSGSIDEERAALSVGPGWEGSFGHGPGSGT